MTFKRRFNRSNKLIICKCSTSSYINRSHLCERCNAMNSLIVDSGNKYIDDFIKETQYTKESGYSEFLEWVPYKKLTNLEHIGRGGFSQIYKATWEKSWGISHKGTLERKKTEVVLKVLNDSQNVDTEFIKELKYTYQFKYTIPCYGVTQNPRTKNYARDGDLNHFFKKNFAEITWNKKIKFLWDIVEGLEKIHCNEILHRDLHGGNILIKDNDNNAIISDLGFSRPANIDSNLSGKSIYGIIPYMAPELFKGQTYSYASDIYSLGMIMWQLTSGHRPFHDQEHGPKLILDILDGKRPEITEDTPECWENLMKRCWHPDPSQRPTIDEIHELSIKFINYKYFNSRKKLNEKNPDEYDIWLEFEEAEEKRLKMVEFKKPFVKNPGYEHPNSRYYSTLLNPMY
ncbi:hypothetical protein Glove_851g16 [Diversispora epigaea]|uniref:Protein kinase domain-containing protein n=1 Tax=Diversispora epigaea TaxID=1348612 RepID=A0A397FYK8_9GLOM|nr:hypothetical protein Glove_851g16 [Diversispora epigaea]